MDTRRAILKPGWCGVMSKTGTDEAVTLLPANERHVGGPAAPTDSGRPKKLVQAQPGPCAAPTAKAANGPRRWANRRQPRLNDLAKSTLLDRRFRPRARPTRGCIPPCPLHSPSSRAAAARKRLGGREEERERPRRLRHDRHSIGDDGALCQCRIFLSPRWQQQQSFLERVRDVQSQSVVFVDLLPAVLSHYVEAHVSHLQDIPSGFDPVLDATPTRSPHHLDAAHHSARRR